MIAALIWAPFQPGCCCLTSAAIPAVIGQAMEVPEITAGCEPVPIPAEATLTPGATTSGFGAGPGLRGPPAAKLAAFLQPVLGTVISASDTEPPSAPACAAPSPLQTLRNGIAHAGCS